MLFSNDKLLVESQTIAVLTLLKPGEVAKTHKDTDTT
jgi:gentisate 1,2-dioxygenase